MLGGIVAFCAGMLVALLCDCPPLTALKRALLGGAVMTVVTWLCAHIALGVVWDGLRRRGEENNAA